VKNVEENYGLGTTRITTGNKNPGKGGRVTSGRGGGLRQPLKNSMWGTGNVIVIVLIRSAGSWGVNQPHRGEFRGKVSVLGAGGGLFFLNLSTRTGRPGLKIKAGSGCKGS